MATAQHLDRRQLLAEHWMLRSLSEHELDQLLRFARVQLFPRNRVIFEQGEPGNALMAVLRGSAKVGTPTRGGKEVSLAAAEPLHPPGPLLTH